MSFKGDLAPQFLIVGEQGDIPGGDPGPDFTPRQDYGFFLALFGPYLEQLPGNFHIVGKIPLSRCSGSVLFTADASDQLLGHCRRNALQPDAL